MMALAATLTAGAASASAVTPGGQDASMKGDFAQAEAEWKRDAAQGNVDAALRLGELYEQLRGDYPEAERWYMRAAERGSIQARYRLSLIALAGNSEVAPNPVKAYKWAILASASNDQWGQLAKDLRSQLEGVLTAAESVEAARQADVWLQQRTGTSTTLTRAAPENGSVFDSPRTTATLDGSVKSASISPPPAQNPPPYAQGEKALAEAMQRVRCGSLQKTTNEKGELVITGTVPDDTERLNLIRVSNALAPEHRPKVQVRVVSQPLCRSLTDLDGIRTASLVADGLYARLSSPSATLEEGDPIRIEVKAGDYPLNLRIDYFSRDGRVLHLLPNDDMPVVKLDAGMKRVFGSGAGQDWRAGGPPFGTELILIVATPQPLDLGKRPAIEDAAVYLSELQRGLRQRSASITKPNLLTTMLVETRAK